MKFKHLLPALLWFVFSTILLTLPGNDLPQAPLFNIPNFDKYVHVILFFILTTLLIVPVKRAGLEGNLLTGWIVTIISSVILYGLAIEFIQKFWVKGRSYDMNDVIADSIGCLVAALVTVLFYYKKIGPDGNQGRNQN